MLRTEVIFNQKKKRTEVFILAQLINPIQMST